MSFLRCRRTRTSIRNINAQYVLVADTLKNILLIELRRNGTDKHTGAKSFHGGAHMRYSGTGGQILSEQWVHFLNEHIIQTHVEKHCSYLPIVGRRSNNDNGRNDESYDEGDSKYGHDGGALSGMGRAPSCARPARNLRAWGGQMLAPSRHPSGAVARTHVRAR